MTNNANFYVFFAQFNIIGPNKEISEKGCVIIMNEKTVFITGGAGIVGSFAVEFLARDPTVEKIVIADIKEDYGETVLNNAVIGSAINGYYHKIVFEKVDLRDLDSIASALEKHKPDVVLQVATMMSSYYYIHIIKREIKRKHLPLKTYLAGHTFAKDFVFVYNVMRALKKTSLNTKVVNLSFPDNTHLVLGKLGLAPHIGAGTIDISVGGIRKKIADHLKIPIHNVNVVMVCHHSIRVTPIEYVPYYLRVYVNGNDITEQLAELKKFVQEGIIASYVGATTNAPMTAASAVSNVLAVLNDTQVIKHAPGPNGLPGGWPVRIGREKVDLVLPTDLSFEEAMKMQEEGLKTDGIERVEDDGTVVFTEEAVNMMREILGLEWPKVKPDEAEEMALDLIKAYKKLEE